MKSDLTYERLAQGEIRLPLSPEDRTRIQQLQDCDKAFLERFPPASVAFPPGRNRSRAPLWFGLGGLTAAAVLILTVPFLGTPLQDTRIKGADQTLLVYHKTETGTELLGTRPVLGQGDEVQIAYLSAERHYGAIYSVDGRGTVTVHFPLNSSQANEVETNQPQLLPYSYKLDDAPDFEVFFLVTSDKPFAVADLKPFLKAFANETEGTLKLPDEFSAISFRIVKKETSR